MIVILLNFVKILKLFFVRNKWYNENILLVIFKKKFRNKNVFFCRCVLLVF